MPCHACPMHPGESSPPVPEAPSTWELGYTHIFCAGTLPPAPCMPQRPGGPCTCQHVCARLSHSLTGTSRGFSSAAWRFPKPRPQPPLQAVACSPALLQISKLQLPLGQDSGALGVLRNMQGSKSQVMQDVDIELLLLPTDHRWWSELWSSVRIRYRWGYDRPASILV